MKGKVLSCLLMSGFLLSLAFVGCTATTTEQGVGAGALLGGAAGAIIGHQQGRAGEGAAIGAGLGAIAGGLTGKAVENNQATSGGAAETTIAICPNCKQRVDVTGIPQNTRVRCPHCQSTFTY